MLFEIAPLLLLVAVVVCFTLFIGVFVYWSNRTDIINKLFLTVCAFIVLWTLSVLLRFWGDDPILVLASARVSFLFASLLAFFLLYFTYYFPRKNSYSFPHKYFIPISLILFFITLTPYTVDRVEITESIQRDLYSWGYYFFVLHFLFCVIVSIYNLLVKDKNMEEAERLQVRYISFGFFISIGLGFMSNVVIPFLTDLTAVAKYGPLATIPFIVFTSMAILKHHLFNIRAIAAEIFVFILWVFLLIRTLLSTSLNDFIINFSLLLATIFIGIFLIRSVMREVKQTESIQALMNMKTEFMQIASHQLRTPVSVIRGMLDMMRSGDLDDQPKEKQREYLDKAYIKSQKLNEIITNILSATEMDIPDFDLSESMQFLNLKDLAEEAIKSHQSLAEEKDITLELEAPDNLPHVMGSAQFLPQVIDNFITNAIQFSGKGGKVKVKIVQEGDKVMLKVDDTGIGISKDDLPKLWKKFARAKNANNMYTDGSGLGLFIAKKIIEGHKDGSVFVDSEPDKGSTFGFHLPVVKET